MSHIEAMPCTKNQGLKIIPRIQGLSTKIVESNFALIFYGTYFQENLRTF